MNIQGKTAIVAGGTGNIGIGIVKQLLLDGADVVVPYRNEGKLQYLNEYIGSDLIKGLNPIKADFGNFNTALQFQEELRKKKIPVDIAVASLGGWWHGGRLSEVSEADYQQVMNENVNSHFYFARAITPLLKEQGSGVYIAIHGPGGIYTRPGTELVTMAGWMQYKMVEFLNDELREYGAKGYELFIAGIYTRQYAGYAKKPDMITPEEIGDYIARLYLGEVEQPDKFAQSFFKADLPWFKI